MKQIVAYKSEDGFVNEDRQKVEEHEKEFAFKTLFNDFTEKHCFHSMTKSDVADVLFENKDELIAGIAKIESIHNKRRKNNA